MPPPCPTHQKPSKWRPAAALATPASRLLALPTAAVSTSGSGTPVSVNLVSEQKDDVFVEAGEYAVSKEGIPQSSLMSSQFQRRVWFYFLFRKLVTHICISVTAIQAIEKEEFYLAVNEVNDVYECFIRRCEI